MRLASGQQIITAAQTGGPGQAADHFGPVGDPVSVLEVLRRGGHIIQPQQLTQALILPVIARGDDEMAVGTLKHLIGCQVGMRVAHPRRRLAGGEIVHRLIAGDRHGAVKQCHVDMLTDAGLVTLMHSRQNRGAGIDPGKDIGDRHAGFLRLAVRFASDRHQARHALNDEIIARAVGVRPGMAETRDRTIDQFGELRRQAGIVQPVFRQSTGLEIFDHDIRIGQEFLDLRLTFLSPEIHSDRGFAPVRRVEIGGGNILIASDEGRAPLTGVIPRRAFHFDHLTSEVRECLTGPRAGQNTRQFDDFQSCKRGGH